MQRRIRTGQGFGVNMYYLGIDAGGSKCAARLCDGGGNILGEGLSGCANMRTGIVNVFASLQEAYGQAITQAGIKPECVREIMAGAGIAGISRKGAQDLLRAQDFPFRSIKFASDAQIANIGAHEGRDGGIVIVGTGSIAIGRVNGSDIQVGGYGFPVSDEGSGAWLGLQAIRQTLWASDNRITHSPLSKKLLARFDGHRSAIIGWMDGASATDYAALAPMIAGHANDGDTIGATLLNRAADHIDLMIDSLRKAGVARIAMTGGLSDTLMHWLPPTTKAELSKSKGDALDGALILARQ